MKGVSRQWIPNINDEFSEKICSGAIMQSGIWNYFGALNCAYFFGSKRHANIKGFTPCQIWKERLYLSVKEIDSNLINLGSILCVYHLYITSVIRKASSFSYRRTPESPTLHLDTFKCSKGSTQHEEMFIMQELTSVGRDNDNNNNTIW